MRIILHFAFPVRYFLKAAAGFVSELVLIGPSARCGSSHSNNSETPAATKIVRHCQLSNVPSVIGNALINTILPTQHFFLPKKRLRRCFSMECRKVRTAL